MTQIVLRTERLHLRTWGEGDDEAVQAMRTRSFLRWLEDDDMPPRATGSWREWADASMADHGFCFWVVERQTDSAFLGYCGLKRVNAEGTDLTGTVEIGWGFAEAHQGQGYALEAARAALNSAFKEHAAPEVVAFAVIGNVPSWRLMEKLGMTRRADLDFHDPAYSAALNPTIVYRITRAEWEAQLS